MIYTLHSEFIALSLRESLNYVIPCGSLRGMQRIYFSLEDILGGITRKESISYFRDSGHGVNNSSVSSRSRKSCILPDKSLILDVDTFMNNVTDNSISIFVHLILQTDYMQIILYAYIWVIIITVVTG